MWKLLEPRSTPAMLWGASRAATPRPLAAQRAGGRSVIAAVCCISGARSDRERGPAAAGRDRVRIADDELRALEVFLVVDLRSREILNAHRVNDELDTEVLDAGIAF